MRFVLILSKSPTSGIFFNFSINFALTSSPQSFFSGMGFKKSYIPLPPVSNPSRNEKKSKKNRRRRSAINAAIIRFVLYGMVCK